MNNNKYLSRKFLVACVIIVISTVGLFTHFVNQQIWLAVVTLAAGSYQASNVVAGRKKQDYLERNKTI